MLQSILTTEAGAPVIAAFCAVSAALLVVLTLIVRHIAKNTEQARPSDSEPKSPASDETAVQLVSDMLRVMPFAIVITQTDGTIRTAYNCADFPLPANPVGMSVFDLFPKEMINAVKLRKAYKTTSSGRSQHLNNLTTKWGDKYLCCDMTVAPLGLADEPYGTIIILRDTTERWSLNRKLVESRDFLRDIIYGSPSSVCVFSKNGDAIMVNDAYLKMLRTERAEIIGRYNIFEDAIYKECGLFPEVQHAFAGNVVALPAIKFNTTGAGHGSGSDTITAQGLLFPLFGPHGAVSNVIVMLNDVTRLKHAETEVMFLSEYNKRIIESMGAGVRVIDRNLHVKYSNDFMRDSIEESPSKHCYDFMDRKQPCENCVVREAIDLDVLIQREYTAENGKIFSYIAAPLTERDGSKCAVTVIRDITENRHLEQQMLQQEKLSTLGILAGGIAHEINNPLGIISMYAQMLADDLENTDQARKHIEVINRNVGNCRKIIQGLLTFARKQPLHKESIDINSCVSEAVAMCRHLIKKSGVELIERLDDRPLPLSGDPVQLQQVFINLLTNAAHAMSDGGTLTIATGKRIMRDGKTRIFAEFRDTGTGMSAEVLEKAFDPFFTTKESGEGTGLGLAVSLSIIEVHEGEIAAQSTPGEGSVFCVLLPALSKPAAKTEEKFPTLIKNSPNQAN